MRGQISKQRLSEPHKKQLQCVQTLNCVQNRVRHGYRFCGASCSFSASLCLLLSVQRYQRAAIASSPASSPSPRPRSQSYRSSPTFVEQRASFAAFPSFSFELMHTRTASIDTRTAAGLCSSTRHAKTTRHAFSQTRSRAESCSVQQQRLVNLAESRSSSRRDSTQHAA